MSVHRAMLFELADRSKDLVNMATI